MGIGPALSVRCSIKDGARCGRILRLSTLRNSLVVFSLILFSRVCGFIIICCVRILRVVRLALISVHASRYDDFEDRCLIYMVFVVLGAHPIGTSNANTHPDEIGHPFLPGGVPGRCVERPYRMRANLCLSPRRNILLHLVSIACGLSF